MSFLRVFSGAARRVSRRTFLSLAAMCAVAGFGAAGCTGENAAGGGAASPPAGASPVAGAASPGAPAAGGGPYKLAFVTNNSSDFWTIARRGTEKADQELDNVTVEFILPDGSAASQKSKLDDLLARGVNGIAISPVDPVNQVTMLNDAAAKTVVVTQDSDAPNSNRLCYVGTDNVAAGRMAGELIKEALPNGGKIMLFVGKKDAQNAKERAQGIQEALKGSKVEIIDTRADDTDRARAQQNAADTLTKYPDVAALVGLWSYNGPAILNAVKAAGKTGQVKIICFDEEDPTLAGIKDGAIFATVVQQPYEFGYQSVKLLAQVAGGDKSAIPADKKIIVPTKAIKQGDVDDFKKKMDELRGRK
jgi:ribose transport system substrate-binding protein